MTSKKCVLRVFCWFDSQCVKDGLFKFKLSVFVCLCRYILWISTLYRQFLNSIRIIALNSQVADIQFIHLCANTDKTYLLIPQRKLYCGYSDVCVCVCVSPWNFVRVPHRSSSTETYLTIDEETKRCKMRLVQTAQLINGHAAWLIVFLIVTIISWEERKNKLKPLILEDLNSPWPGDQAFIRLLACKWKWLTARKQQKAVAAYSNVSSASYFLSSGCN